MGFCKPYLPDRQANDGAGRDRSAIVLHLGGLDCADHFRAACDNINGLFCTQNGDLAELAVALDLRRRSVDLVALGCPE